MYAEHIYTTPPKKNVANLNYEQMWNKYFIQHSVYQIFKVE